jgi:hypothetical protein
MGISARHPKILRHDRQHLARRVTTAAIHRGVAFNDGTSTSSSPPAALNCSRARIPISSSVSRQSATNAGQNTASRFLPARASSSSTTSVNGLIHGVRPSRDWNDTV